MKKTTLIVTTLSILLVTNSISYSQVWKRTGNNISPNEFLGTSNNKSLVFKVNSQNRMNLTHNNETKIYSETLELYENSNSETQFKILNSNSNTGTYNY